MPTCDVSTPCDVLGNAVVRETDGRIEVTIPPPKRPVPITEGVAGLLVSGFLGLLGCAGLAVSARPGMDSNLALDDFVVSAFFILAGLLGGVGSLRLLQWQLLSIEVISLDEEGLRLTHSWRGHEMVQHLIPCSEIASIQAVLYYADWKRLMHGKLRVTLQNGKKKHIGVNVPHDIGARICKRLNRRLRDL